MFFLNNIEDMSKEIYINEERENERGGRGVF